MASDAGDEAIVIPIVGTVAQGEFASDGSEIAGTLHGAIRLEAAYSVRISAPAPVGDTNLGTLMHDRLNVPLTIDTDEDGEPDAWPFEADFVAPEVELAQADQR